ncbi:MAG: MATE family efflux transporter [Erysipelotrichaceae bacterium]|nr:MATE family efflux transporter [Erysipelotrichaceae bacterium]
MNHDLTKGKIAPSIALFALPMIAGNFLQQLYNVVDTIIVSHTLGSHALASVGASFALITFLTSIILGLGMGSGVVFSHAYGANDMTTLKKSFHLSFVFILSVALILNIITLLGLHPILVLLQIPSELFSNTYTYMQIILFGFLFVACYNYYSAVLRSIGNSLIPLVVLFICTVSNIILDFIFILLLQLGIAGAAWATICSQALSAFILFIYCKIKVPEMRLTAEHWKIDLHLFHNIIQYSLLTSIQQSIMNFGILMVQGRVNSFGASVMAAFGAAVKIDAFAYMPAQDFGNAFSTFIAQNHGANQQERVKQGTKTAMVMSTIFCVISSFLVIYFAKELMLLFVNAKETEIIHIGIQYLQIEASCYVGIGLLFLFYGLFRGLGKPSISILLTIVSLGTRVLLTYTLSSIPTIGLYGIWWSIPIGWILADGIGFLLLKKDRSPFIQRSNNE